MKASLSRLGLAYLDLYLVHAPFFEKAKCNLTQPEVWSQMESLVDKGLTRYIGVSNYRIRDFEEILPHARINPICNQIEYHPYLQQHDLIQYCQNHGIIVTAYSPLTPLHNKPDGPVNPFVEKIAAKYQRSPAQILLQWALQKGIYVITTSKQEARMKEYVELDLSDRGLQLTHEEIKEIDHVGKTIQFRKYWTDQVF